MEIASDLCFPRRGPRIQIEALVVLEKFVRNES